MHNPFLIVRLVFMTLLVYLNLVILAFASWNIHATTSGALPAPGLAVFLISNSVLLCLLVALALGVPRSAHVKHECLWTAMFSVLQFAAAVVTTVTGPFIMCQPQTGNWEACASSSLLVPTAWLSAFTLITYLFVLFIVTFTHSRTQPTIWSAAICSVPWFTRGESDARGDVSCRPDEKNDSQQFSYLNKGDVDAPPDLPQKADGQGELPLWARRLHVRRGIDPPFAASSLTTPSARGSSATATAPAPLPSAPTQQSKLAQPHGSRFIERFQESNFEPPVPWWETPAQYGLQFTPHTEVFPHKVDDHDSPIPLPHLSEWIRADAVPRIDAHVSTPPVTFP